MVDYPIIRFVANAGDTTARLDLNDGITWTTDHEGFSLGAPAFEADALAVGALYGMREVTLTPVVQGAPATAFPELSKLSIEIMRQRNWLMFQYDADSEPFWLRTYRSAPQPIDLENVYVDGDSGTVNSQWRKPVTLRADAFARGAKVTLPTITINNDPAGTGNKSSYTLPTIEGDAPAPLQVILDSPTPDNFKSPMISTSATEQPFTPPLLVTTWTLFGSTKTTSAPYVAGGYHAEPNTGDSAEGWATITPPFAGRYKAYLRAGFSDTDSEFDLDAGGGRVRVTKRALGDPAADPWQWWGTSGSQGWIDLGTVTLGRGWNEVLSPTLQTTVPLKITRLSGTGKIRVDALLFVPIDDADATVEGRTLKVDPLITPTGFRTKYYADGERREMWAVYDEAGWKAGELGGLAGRFGQVVPGRTNVLHLLRNVDTGTDEKADTTTVTLSYFPRRLDPLGS